MSDAGAELAFLRGRWGALVWGYAQWAAYAPQTAPEWRAAFCGVVCRCETPGDFTEGLAELAGRLFDDELASLAYERDEVVRNIRRAVSPLFDVNANTATIERAANAQNPGQPPALLPLEIDEVLASELRWRARRRRGVPKERLSAFDVLRKGKEP